MGFRPPSSGGSGSASWGSIAGTLSAQTDLQTALDAKQDSWSWSFAKNPPPDFDHFHSNMPNKLAWQAQGTTAIWSVDNANPVANSKLHPGQFKLTLNTATTGHASYSLKSANAMMTLGGMRVRQIWVIKADAPDVSSSYDLYLGNHDGVGATSTVPQNGVYVGHELAISPNWLLFSANGGSRSTVDSGIPVDGTKWVTIGFELNEVGTSLQLYAASESPNVVAVGSPITTNINTTTVVTTCWKVRKPATMAVTKTLSFDLFVQKLDGTFNTF